jgi:hypothetical protein
MAIQTARPANVFHEFLANGIGCSFAPATRE